MNRCEFRSILLPERLILTVPTDQNLHTMKHPLDFIVSNRIAEAEKAGAFDNLPGAGKPLDLSEDPFDALMRRAMTEDGANAPIVTMRREIATLKKDLETKTGPDRKKALEHLSNMQMRLAMELESLKKRT